MHPLVDLSTLSDEELVARIGRARQYLEYQSSLGHMPTAQSIRTIIEALEDERSKRILNSHGEEFKKKNPKDKDPIEIGNIE